MNNETTVSRWIDITTSNDGLSRSRRVVATRQHFQPASKPPVSSQTRSYLSLSPPDISNNQFDLSGNGWSRPLNISSRPHRLHCLHKYMCFFLCPSPPDISNSRIYFQMTARHDPSRPVNIFRKFLEPSLK